MERLTKRDEKGKVTINFEAIGKPFGNDTVYDVFDLYYIACDRLAAYEDTGLTPEQIQAQQQEIERLNKALDDWKYIAKCDADHIAALTTDKDELVKVLKKAREAINGYSTCPYCWGVNGHAKGCKFYEALQNIDALIGGKEDA